MSKDVIYIEPEDDITDVISRIKSSSEKILAIVPPKKLGIMRSAINVKLIAKTAKTADKAAVIITTDPSLIKLAAFSGLSVAKTLNSRPMLPSEFTNCKKQETEEIAGSELDLPAEDDSKAEQVISEKPVKKVEKKDDAKVLDFVDEKPKTAKLKNKKPSKIAEKIPGIEKYRKFIIAGAAGGVALIVLIVWMFVIAPYVKITVKMKMASSSISENVSLVTSEKNQSNIDGKFLLEQIKYEDEASVEFEATGKANKGEKATGSVTVLAAFSRESTGGSTTLPAGSTVTISGKKFVTTAAATAAWKEAPKTGECEDKTENYCYIKTTVKVQASDGGTEYNIAAATSGSVGVGGFTFKSSTAMTGGTDKNVAIVTEKDLEEARSQLEEDDASEEAKKKLSEKIGDDVVKIEPSFKTEIADEKTNIKKGEEVEDGKKVKMTAKVVYSIYVVDKTAIDEFINNFEKDKIAENDRIYSTGTPFFERYLEDKDGNYTAKLKTTVKVGPEVSEASVLETVKGKKVGEVKALVKDMSSNITDVPIEPNFPWVHGVPNDSNKVEIKIEVDESEEK